MFIDQIQIISIQYIMILYFIFFIIIVAPSTTTTSANCPQDFNVEVYNKTIDSNIAFNNRMAQLAISTRRIQNQQKLQNIIITGNYGQLYNFLLSLTAPYIVLAIFYFLLICIIISCTVCEKSCPPFKPWKRDLDKFPYKKSQLKILTIFTLLFAIITATVAIISFTSLGSLDTQIQYTKCGMFIVLDSTMNGDSNHNWGGINFLMNQIQNVSSSLQNISSVITTYFPNNSWLLNKSITLENLNNNLGNTYSNSTLLSPNPNSYSNITPLFIYNNFGPKKATNNLVSDIKIGLSTTQILINQAYAIDLYANILNDQVSKGYTSDNFKLIVGKFQSFNSQLSNFQKNLNTFSISYIDQNYAYLRYVMEIVLGFVFAGSLITIIGSSASYFCNLYRCKNMVHLSWMIFGLMYFGILGLSYVFLPGGVVITDFCSFYHNILTKRSTFQQLGNYYSQNSLSYLQGCIYDNGQILDKFNSLSQINLVTNLFTAILNYSSMIDSTSNTYVNTSLTQSKIANWISLLQSYRDGLFIDSNDTTESNPFISIQNLSKITLNGSNGQKCTSDIWVFQYANCSYGSNLYRPNLVVNPLMTICLSFNDTPTISSGRIWNISDFNNRYISIQSTCPNTYTNILKYGTPLINYRDSRINLYQSIINDLNNIQSNYTSLMNMLDNFKTNINLFTSNVSTLQNQFTDKINGLNFSRNCTIIADNMRYVYNSFCVKFINEVYKLGIIFLVLSLTLIANVITANLFAIRYGKIQKDLNQSKVVPDSSTDNIKKSQKQQNTSSEHF